MNLREMRKLAAEFFDVPERALTGSSRKAHIAQTRFLAMRAMRDMGRNWEGRTPSLSQIGAALGARDHTTILHGLNRADEILEASQAARAAMKEFTDEIRSRSEVFFTSKYHKPQKEAAQ